MEEPKEKSSLRVYVGKNRVPIALLTLILGGGGAAYPFASKQVISVAKAQEAAIRQQFEIDQLKKEIAEERDKNQKTKNTVDRVDDNVNLLCDGLSELLKKPIRCKNAPEKPE